MMRRKLVLLATIIAITGGALRYVSQQTPMYTAEALIHVQNRDAQVVQIEGVVEELIADPATIESEIQFLTSRAFLRRMVEQLNLVEDPEFNAALREEPTSLPCSSCSTRMRYVPEDWLPRCQRRSRSRRLRSARSCRDELNRVVGTFGSRLEVEPGRPVLRDLARRSCPRIRPRRPTIANAMADEYLVSQVEAKYQAARAGDRLARQADPGAARRGARGRGQDRRVPQPATTWSTPTTDNPITLQFFQLNTQLALAQAERAGAEARLGQARSHARLRGRGRGRRAGAELAADGQTCARRSCS